jgi:Xylose isomerase-like TIM barrel
MPHLSVSTWSLHRALGAPAFYGPENGGQWVSQPTKPAKFSLLELPAKIAAHGFRSLDLCHFHLPSCDAGYLAELRTELQRAGVTLWTLLVDSGDITHTEHSARDLAWVQQWLPHAGALGAKTVRVIAGKSQPDAQSLQTSLRGMQQLAQVAQQHGVQLTIENWFALLGKPEQVFWLLEQMHGALQLKLDFGNWSGPTKYDDLAQIAPFAESCHSKAHFTARYEIGREDFVRCLEITKTAGFAGPHTLIYDDAAGEDEWQGLQIEADLVKAYL